MLEKVHAYLEKAFQTTTSPKLLLACSGGVDSMVLVHLLDQLPWPIGIAHVNFQLRQEASDADEIFVYSFAQQHQIPVHISREITSVYAKENKLSIQMAARHLRYAFFDRLMEEEGYSHLLTAHHLDDQIETFLINAGRGSGVKGLCGISDHQVLRPLLSFSKEQIVCFAKEHQIAWREDTSNEKTDYLRNAHRHELLPAWKKIHGQQWVNIHATFQYLQATQQVLDDVIADFNSKWVIEKDEVIKFSVAAIRQTSSVDYFLHALFSPYGFHHLNDLRQLLTTQSGKQIFSSTHRLLKDREFLLLTSINQFNQAQEFLWEPSQDLIEPISIRRINEPIQDPSVACLNAKLLKFPLTLRKFREGDYFYPIGMNGKKKIAKFFKDEKLTQFEKEKQWLLCSGEDIVWVVGRRIDARFAANYNYPKSLILQCQ